MLDADIERILAKPLSELSLDLGAEPISEPDPPRAPKRAAQLAEVKQAFDNRDVRSFFPS